VTGVSGAVIEEGVRDGARSASSVGRKVGVPVLDDEEGRAVEGRGVAEDEEFLGVGSDVEDTEARSKGMDLKERGGLAESEAVTV